MGMTMDTNEGQVVMERRNYDEFGNIYLGG